MAEPGQARKVRGTARVAFIAQLDAITAELKQGYTAQAIYDRHAAKLGGVISYPQFARYVRQLREQGVVPPLWGPSSPAQHPPAPAAAAPSPIPEPAPTPARSRTFDYDPVVRPEDEERLIGPGASLRDAPGQPTPARTFRHSPVPAEGELERLLGPSFIKPRSGRR